MNTQNNIDQLSYKTLGAAIEVHKVIGPGLLESVYEHCFTHELSLRGLRFERQRNVPINYKGLIVDAQLRFDVLVEDLIVVELKAIEAISPIHKAVVLSYMQMLQKPKGIIINFNCTNIMKEGQVTLVNDFYSRLPKQ